MKRKPYILLGIIFLISCTFADSKSESLLSSNDPISIKNKSYSKIQTVIKGDTLYIFDENLSWEPFTEEKKNLDIIEGTFTEISRRVIYNENSEFHDTLITYKRDNNEIIVYVTEDSRSFRQAKLVTNGFINFREDLKMGLDIKILLKKYGLDINKNYSTIIICPDEDGLQELILSFKNNSIATIDFYAYYD